MKKQWCLFCEREFLPRLSPKRPHDPSGEHNSKKMTHHEQTTPKTPQTPGPPIKATPPLLEGPIEAYNRRTRRPTVQSRAAGSRACAAATKRQNRQPRHQEAAHDTPSDGRRRAHGGPEPHPGRHARASNSQDSSPADAVAPQVVRLPDHGRQLECGLRVQLVEGRGPETGHRTAAATAAVVEALELARLVPLDHQ